MDWVTANAANLGIKVANMSLGFQGTSTDASSFSPANHPDVITVSAIADSDGSCGAEGPSTSYGADDTFATFSNYGSLIELAAPGVNIYSTWIGNKTYPKGTYRTASGTSMAAPHVAGAAALYLASNSGASPAQGGMPSSTWALPSSRWDARMMGRVGCAAASVETSILSQNRW